MTEADLDLCYTALCRALGEVGPQRSELLLAMVALALLARQQRPGDVLELIARSRDRCLEDAAGPASGAGGRLLP